MAAPRLRVDVDGLKDLRKALRDIDKGFARELGQAGKRAAEIVADEARPKLPVRSGRARASVRATAGRGGSVVAGGARAPYVPWLTFGGNVGRDGSVQRPVIRGGRYFYPALKARRGDVVETFEQSVEQLIEKAGLK